VAGKLYRARQAHELDLRNLEAEMNSRLAMVDAVYAAEIRELKEDVTKKLKEAEDANRALQRSMDEMHRDEARAWKEKVRKLEGLFREQLAEKKQELRYGSVPA
jgi:FtsZ-binding cell division protein ZapB